MNIYRYYAEDDRTIFVNFDLVTYTCEMEEDESKFLRLFLSTDKDDYVEFPLNEKVGPEILKTLNTIAINGDLKRG